MCWCARCTRHAPSWSTNGSRGCSPTSAPRSSAWSPVWRTYLHDDFTVRTENMREGETKNAHSHLRQLIGGRSSECIAVGEGSALLGQWQKVMFIELDRAREREVLIQVCGMPRQAPVQLVELVDGNGVTIGTAEKMEAHLGGGRLHRAFSVFLLDAHGRLLLQQRAKGKYHSGGLWSNTCCGHPSPGESPHDAAIRRLREELGIRPKALCAVGTVRYHVADPVSGLAEQEWNHLFVGRFDGIPDPAPAEVAGYRSVFLGELLEMQKAEPFTPWFANVFDAVKKNLWIDPSRSLDGAAHEALGMGHDDSHENFNPELSVPAGETDLGNPIQKRKFVFGVGGRTSNEP
jgi:isopentenyl-diphosphate delta-isomerase